MTIIRTGRDEYVVVIHAEDGESVYRCWCRADANRVRKVLLLWHRRGGVQKLNTLLELAKFADERPLVWTRSIVAEFWNRRETNRAR